MFRRLWEKRKRKNREAAARHLIERKNIKPRAGEPLPPWIKFPGFPFFDGLERFGATGIHDIYKEWTSFWTGLTINQRQEYFRHYDLGDEWPDRSNWYQLWVAWEKYLEDPDVYLIKLVEEAILQPRPGEPAPPWVKYPDLYDPTAYWNHGKGFDYLNEIFLPFFGTLSENRKLDYLNRHDLGLGWDNRDEWLFLIGWKGDVTK